MPKTQTRSLGTQKKKDSLGCTWWNQTTPPPQSNNPKHFPSTIPHMIEKLINLPRHGHLHKASLII